MFYLARLGWDEPLEEHALPRRAATAVLVATLGLLVAGTIIAGAGVAALAGCAALCSVLFLGDAAHVLPGSEKRRHEVIYLTAPSWKVGEDERDRDLTDLNRTGAPASELYPGDYPGMVLAVKESPASWQLGDLASPNRQVVGLDLTAADVRALHDRREKIDPVTLERVSATVADRYGATLTGLVEKFGSVAAVEAAEAEAEAQELSGDGEKHELRTEFVRLKRALPETVVHSGAGLYEVGPAKTYATIQSALDQLWTDQGSATFTASQYIRIFADSYTENVTPNASFNPNELSGYVLVVEGDPGDDRANIDLTLVSGNGFYVNCDQILIRHMSITGPSAITYTIRAVSGCFLAEINDCVVTTAVDDFMIDTENGVVVTDSTLTGTSMTTRQLVKDDSDHESLILNCIITGASKATSSQALVQIGWGRVEGCVLDGGLYGILMVSDLPFYKGHYCNNTFYNNKYGYGVQRSIGNRINAINNIFKDCTSVLLASAAWPEETSTQFGPRHVHRNNCYHGYTNFMQGPGSVTKTYAQWSAYNGVDASGDLDATDPLLTNPGAGDYSLQSGSPCQNAGRGSGVIAGYNGVDFDANEPDIGAWSSGAAAAVTEPIAPVISNAVDDETGTSATLTIDADNAADVISIRYRALGVEAWTLFGSTRTGDGDIQITGLTATRHVFLATAARSGLNSLPSDPAIVWVTNGATSASGYDRIHSLLNQELAVVQASNVASENSEYAKTVGTGWLRETFLPAEPMQADLGTSGRNRFSGIYQIDVFEETGKGSNAAETMAETLLVAFKRGTTMASSGVTVRVEKAWRSPAVQEGDRYQVPVTVRWFAYVAN
jgi:hypothetical protein